MTGPGVECVVPSGALLGECPLWSPADNVLYWVDIDGRAIHRFDPAAGSDEMREIGTRPGSIGLTDRSGTLLLGTEDQIAFFDWETGLVAGWIEVESPVDGVRLNDGRTDRAGRYWTGSMFDPVSAGRFDGVLYRIDPDGRSVAVKESIGVTNGIAFSPDGQTMYFADTQRDTVWSYDYDPETGERRGERVFVDFSTLPGRPDGATVDDAGCYWVACVFGWAVARISPAGVVDRIIEVPVHKPTMAAFGGSDLGTLYITSIGGEGDPGEVEPGGLLAIDSRATGLPETPFAGPVGPSAEEKE